MRRRILISATAIAVVVIGGWLFAHTRGGNDIPTAQAHRGEFVEYQLIRGEIKASHSVEVTAPFSAGDLQIIKLVKTGTPVKEGDVLVQFDTTTIQRTLAQKETDLRSAEAQIRQSEAQGKLDFEQKATDQLTAKFDVDRAKLDVSKQEIVSEIDGAKTRLTLQDKQAKLLTADEKIKSSEQSAKADLASMKQKRAKALFDVQIARRQLESLTLRARSEGVVSVSRNYRAGNFFGGGATPDFKEGDRAWPGAVILEIPDQSSFMLKAHVDEIDRGRLSVKQDASVHVDAIPDHEFKASIEKISALGKPDFTSWPPPKNFDVEFEISDRDPRLRPGMSSTVRVAVDRVPNALLVPVTAVFTKNGKTVVYVQQGSSFEEHAVSVAKQDRSDALISSGLKDGDKVALKDPTATRETPSQ
jgi:HlyD family secretion protein